MADGREVDYFRITPWYHWIWVSVTYAIVITSGFCPEAIPYSMMGPFGDLLYYMNYSHQTIVRVLLLLIAVIHISEGYYVYVLARRLNINSRTSFWWGVQTGIVGFTSLNMLKAYRDEQKKE